MMLLYRFLYVFFVAAVINNALTAEIPRSSMVRVLLDTEKRSSISPNHASSYLFHSDDGFLVWNSLSRRKETVKEKELTVVCQKSTLSWGRGKNKDRIVFIAPQGNKGINYRGKYYSGYCVMTLKGDYLYLVNYVPLEDYVCAVLKTESWPGWPLEVNKVFAIVSRSYVLAESSRARKRGKVYDVKNTNAHQTYQGRHDSAVLHKAVAETRGVCLVHAKEPILAMFDSCCGGVVPALIHDFDFKKVPYLKRSYSCVYCRPLKIFTWQVEFNLKDFEKIVAKKYSLRGSIKKVTVSERDKAGCVRAVDIRTGSQCHTLSGRDMYMLVKEIKSFCFDIYCNKNMIKISGRGYGHHVGLCQWGARELVRHGWSFDRILFFYYPGTKFMKLNVSL